MAGQRFELTFDAKLNVAQMKGALGQIQSSLNGLHLPANITKDLQTTFQKLSNEISNFERLSGKDITSKADFSKIEKSAEKVVDLFDKLKSQVKDLGNMSDSQLAKMFPDSVTKNIQNATKALTDYQNNLDKATAEADKAKKAVDDLNQKIAAENTKTVVDDKTYKGISDGLKAAEAEVVKYQQQLDSLIQKQQQMQNSLNQPMKSSSYRALIKDIADVEQKLKNAQQAAQAFANQKATTTTFTKHAQALTDLQSKLQSAIQKFQQLDNVVKQLESTGQGGGLKQLIEDVGKITGLDMSKFSSDTQGVSNAIQSYLNQALQNLRSELTQTNQVVEGSSAPIEELENNIKDAASAYEQFADSHKEVAALKSRIQYFFGLTNTINLFKQAVRGAISTVKELDAVMTETAVVTDFSVEDMWKQLPEYTQRANELGVSTKQAYEAATLYYQQGLQTNEVNAMSVETLKMARIAGLDAAEATDRMTNAIRGFNMEINETNAQRIDDVYSRLAAISASNVDEISVAMTKVASLANNANMEFETTAAFLAQIIETTRESAETAGTALKTVVARFSEVKKLFSEGQLMGTDEEGSSIDVNKVSAALRTAGIDLNKFFLNEVGLDDIFMELSEKWDTLTTVQQRYIATQAAGSRQQSRFIALMSDYARMQYLVGEAYNAEGASAEQFAKTQESLQSKLARLQNAWNEFLMGLANSTIIKGIVDILTTLINAVNKVTDVFGKGTGSIIKWVAALGTMRGINALFKSGGMVEALLGGTMFAKAGTTAGTTLGKGILTSLQSTLLGKGAMGIGSFISGGALAGGGALVAGLGAVAVAAGVAFAAYKKLYSISPQGQLEALQKQEDKLKEIANQAQKTAKEQADALSNYQKQTEAINNAETGAERSVAIESRNEYILSLLEKDATYAKYISSMAEEGGQIVLTLDEDALAAACEEAAKAATQASIDAYKASFDTNVQKETIAQDEAESLLSQINWYKDQEKVFDEDYSDIIDALTAKYVAAIQEQSEAVDGMRTNARLAYQNMLKDEDISTNLKNQLSDAMAQISAEITKETLSADDLKKVQAIASSNGMQELLDAITNVDTDVALTGIEDLDDMLKALGITSDEGVSAFKRLADALGLSEDQAAALTKRLKDYAKQQKQQQAQAQQDLRQRFQNIGVEEKGDQWLNEANVKTQTQANKVFTEIEPIVSKAGQKQFAESLFNSKDFESTIQNAQTLVNSFNMDKPIQAYRQLQDAATNTTDKITANLAQSIIDSNQIVFSKGNLIRTALHDIANDYEDVQKQIDKLIKKNGEITADDILDLADACDELQILLDDCGISAENLADALTLVGDGVIGIDDISDALIYAMDQATTFEEIVQHLHDYIANFDEGIDYGESADFFLKKAEELQELTDNFEFGNQRTRNLWKAIFGDNYLEVWGKGENEMKRRIEEFANWIDNDGYGFFNDSRIQQSLGLSSDAAGSIKWDLSKFNTWDNAIDAVIKAAEDAGTTLSKEAAEAFIEQYVSHIDKEGFEEAAELTNRTIVSAIQKSWKSFGDETIITQAELDALSAKWGMSAEQIKEAYKKATGNTLMTLGTDWIDTSTLVEYVSDTLGGSLEEAAQTLRDKSIIIDGENGPVLVFDYLTAYLKKIGVAEEDIPRVAKQLESDLQEQVPDLKLDKDADLALQVADTLGVSVTEGVVTKITEAIENAANGEDAIKITLQNIIIDEVKNVTPENKTVVTELVTKELQDTVNGEPISISVENLVANLKENGIEPGDPDFPAAVSMFLASYYSSHSGAVELTTEQVKAYFDTAGVEVSDAEVDKIVKEANRQATEKAQANPDAHIIDIKGVKVHINADGVTLPTQEEIDALVQAAQTSDSTAIRDLVYNTLIQANMAEQQTAEIADQYQTEIDKHPLEYKVKLAASGEDVSKNTADLSYKYRQIYDTDSFSGANLSNKVSGGVKIDLDTTSIDQLQTLINQTSGHEIEVKVTTQESKQRLDELTAQLDELGYKIETVENDGEVIVKITTDESTLKKKISDTQEFYNDPGNALKIQAEIEPAKGKNAEVDTTANVTQIKVTEASTEELEAAAQQAAENIKEAIQTNIDSGITEASENGAEGMTQEITSAVETIASNYEKGMIDAGQAAAEADRIALQNGISSVDVYTILYSKLTAPGGPAGQNLANAIAQALGSQTFYINVQANVSGLPEGQASTGGIVAWASGAAAKGGKVQSAASSSHVLAPGPTLTGEEGPEIVWNKQQGYAYITGEQHPEFQNLQPGDRVFDARETRRILQNAVTGGMIPAMATGRWNPNVSNRSSSSRSKRSGGSGSSRDRDSSSSSKSSDYDKGTNWRNELDWLYNLMEDIAELERWQTKLAERHDRYLSDISKTGRDLYNVTQQELDTLYTERDNQNVAMARRLQEMDELIGSSGYSRYVWWNQQDATLEIDWDAIEAIQDKDTYDEIKDLISRAEKVQDQIDEAEDALYDIEDKIKEIEDRYLQEFVDFQNRVLDSVVAKYQQNIDNLEELNSTLEDTNNSILNSLQNEINLSRQIRDNTAKEDNLKDLEAQLAYLRRDTTGANSQRIRELESNLNDARQEYSDTLVDQEIDRLSDANEKATEQRQQQIDLLQAQLDYWQSSGGLWDEVNRLIQEGMDNNGSLISGSELDQILKQGEEYEAMSAEGQAQFDKELRMATNVVGAYLIKMAEGLEGRSAGVWADIPEISIASQKIDMSNVGSSGTSINDLEATDSESAALLGQIQDAYNQAVVKFTDGFMQLADSVPALIGGPLDNSNTWGDLNIDFTMNVDSLGSDYDVDQLTDRIKENLYDIGSYRNNNVLNFSR